MSTALSNELELPRGAVITCPNPHCRDKIARLKTDLKPGVKLSSSIFDDSGQGLRLDKKPQCKTCNFHWYVNFEDISRIHTGKGWFPTEKGIESLIAKMH